MKAIRNYTEQGQDLVEFAITLPLLFFLLIIIIDLGRLTFYYATLNNAVREGARFGAVVINDCLVYHSKTMGGVKQDVQNFLRETDIGLDLSTSDITVNYPTITFADANNCTPPLNPAPSPGTSTVIVSATYDFNPILGSPLILLGSINLGPLSSMTLQSSTTMHIEQY